MSVYEVQKRLREIQQNEPVFAALRGRGFTLHHVGPYIDEQKMGHLDIIEFLAIKDETAEPIIVDHQLLTEKGSLS
jgi:hypothetical protein